MNEVQKNIIARGQGFIAALDQSGGSTPKALERYGVLETDYVNEKEMFEQIHKMRTRIIKSPVFNSDKILAVILFTETMHSQIDSLPSAQFLWEHKHIVSFLKIDQGLEDKAHGVQLMKDIRNLETILSDAKVHNIFGTKMRSVIWENNEIGIKSIVHQQFLLARHMLDSDLVPIIEPEVSINADHKLAIELKLRDEIMTYLDKLHEDEQIILKLTPPETPNFYEELVNDPRVLRLVFLSGGHSIDKANHLLQENKGVIASFSRALTQGLNISQSEEEFNDVLGKNIELIFDASTNK